MKFMAHIFIRLVQVVTMLYSYQSNVNLILQPLSDFIIQCLQIFNLHTICIIFNKYISRLKYH